MEKSATFLDVKDAFVNEHARCSRLKRLLFRPFLTLQKFLITINSHCHIYSQSSFISVNCTC